MANESIQDVSLIYKTPQKEPSPEPASRWSPVVIELIVGLALTLFATFGAYYKGLNTITCATIGAVGLSLTVTLMITTYLARKACIPKESPDVFLTPTPYVPPTQPPLPIIKPRKKPLSVEVKQEEKEVVKVLVFEPKTPVQEPIQQPTWQNTLRSKLNSKEVANQIIAKWPQDQKFNEECLENKACMGLLNFKTTKTLKHVQEILELPPKVIWSADECVRFLQLPSQMSLQTLTECIDIIYELDNFWSKKRKLEKLQTLPTSEEDLEWTLELIVFFAGRGPKRKEFLQSIEDFNLFKTILLNKMRRDRNLKEFKVTKDCKLLQKHFPNNEKLTNANEEQIQCIFMELSRSEYDKELESITKKK